MLAKKYCIYFTIIIIIVYSIFLIRISLTYSHFSQHKRNCGFGDIHRKAINPQPIFNAPTFGLNDFCEVVGIHFTARKCYHQPGFHLLCLVLHKDKQIVHRFNPFKILRIHRREAFLLQLSYKVSNLSCRFSRYCFLLHWNWLDNIF